MVVAGIFIYFQLRKDLFQSLQCFYSSVFMKVDVLPLFDVMLLLTFRMFWVWVLLAIDVNKYKLKVHSVNVTSFWKPYFSGVDQNP